MKGKSLSCRMRALKVNSRRWEYDFLGVFFGFVCLQLVFLQTGGGVALSFSGLLWVNHLYIRRERRQVDKTARHGCFVVY